MSVKEVGKLVRGEQTGKEKNLPPSMPLYRLLAEGVIWIKGVSSCLKIQSKVFIFLS